MWAVRVSGLTPFIILLVPRAHKRIPIRTSTPLMAPALHPAFSKGGRLCSSTTSTTNRNRDPIPGLSSCPPVFPGGRAEASLISLPELAWESTHYALCRAPATGKSKTRRRKDCSEAKSRPPSASSKGRTSPPHLVCSVPLFYGRRSIDHRRFNSIVQ